MKKKFVLLILITFVIMLSVLTISVKADIINTSNGENNLLMPDNELMPNCISENCLDVPIGGGNGVKPDFIGYVPEYLESLYYIFMTEGSEIFQIDDILVYKFTYKFNNLDVYYTYTMSINVLYQYTKRSYIYPGSTSLTLKVKEFGNYYYMPIFNEVYRYSDFSRVQVKDITMKMEIISNDIAFSESEYYGNVEKARMLSGDVTYFAKYINDYGETILDILPEEGDKNTTVDYKLTCSSYYSDQVQNNEVCNSLNTNSNFYYLKYAGNYLTLSSKMTYKEQEESNFYIRYYYSLSIGAEPIDDYVLPVETYYYSFIVPVNN